MSLERVLRSWKTHILYVGMAWMAAFCLISFTACERNFTFQLFNLLHILSLIYTFEVPIRDFPTKVSKPSQIFLMTLGWLHSTNSQPYLTFGLMLTKYIYTSNILCILHHLREFALQTRRLSSAKKMYGLNEYLRLKREL